MKPRFRNVAAAALAAAAAALLLTAQPASYPANKPVDITSCDVLRDVLGKQQPEAFYANAWQSFIALICSADLNKGRGVAATPQSFAGTPVFETYKSSWEIFPSSDRFPDENHLPAPADANDYGGADFNPCKQPGSAGELTLGSISKFVDIRQAGPGGYKDLLWPIAARNSKYVHYLTQYNSTAFQEIQENGWYLVKNTKSNVQFPEGSIVLKSAWVETEGLPEAEIRRLYKRYAWVQDPVNGDCGQQQKQVALLALHVVQRTQTRPERIWASFEQEDNVEYCPPGASGCHDPGSHPAGYTFCLKGQQMHDTNPLARQPPVEHPQPVVIQRFQKLSKDVEDANKTYLDALRKKLPADSPWLHYRLVLGQWLDEPCGQPPCPFFDTGIWTWTNPVMETYFQKQKDIGTCMGCHSASLSDFTWSLQVDGWPQDGARIDALQKVMDRYNSQFR